MNTGLMPNESSCGKDLTLSFDDNGITSKVSLKSWIIS